MKTAALILACLLLWAQPAQAQPAIEGSGGSTIPLSATCAGTNKVLYAWSTNDDANDNNHVLVFNTTETMTEVIENIGAGRYIAMHRLVNPTSTTANITASSGTPGIVAYICLSGVDQGDPDDAAQSENNGGAPAETASGLTVSSAVGDLVISGLAANNKNTGFATAAGTGQTERVDVGDTSLGVAVSTQTGAASVVPNWTWTGAVSFGHVAMNVNAAGGGGGTRRRQVVD